MSPLALYEPPRARRTYGSEGPWLELLDDVGLPELRAAFIAAGATPTVAGNLVWFLEEQRTLSRHLSRNARAGYRRVLLELDRDEVRELARGIAAA